MIGAALIAGVVVPAFLGASCLRLPGVSSTLLATYVLLFAEITAVTTLLSPFRAVTRTGLAVVEIVLVIVGGLVWVLAGRPTPSLSRARAVAGSLFRDPVTVTFAVVVGIALGYELLLVLTVPPNNWDSLTYHLARVAAWVQHDGVYWIPNAPTDRMNEFPPLAEQQILYLFVATGTGALFALPQFAAELAILVAIFMSSRRLGYEARLAACAALFFASLALVALESTTAQNDLVATSLICAACALLLGKTRADAEVVLAGVAGALALGVKLTTAFALPILLGLALLRGRRTLSLFGVSGILGFTALAIWGFVRNAIATGSLFGDGGGRVEQTAHPAVAGLVLTGYREAYRLLDLSGFSPWTLWATIVVALCAVCGGALLVLMSRDGRRARTGDVLLASIPLLAPVITVVIALGARQLARGVSLPILDPAYTFAPFRWRLNTRSNEDLSAFGVLGGLVVLGLPLFSLLEGIHRRVDRRVLILAAAVPVYLALLALAAKYNPWLSRLVLVPVGLVAPLCARLFQRRPVAVTLVAMASLTLALTHLRNELKPLDTGRAPWALSQPEAVELNFVPRAGAAAARLERVVPSEARIGALLGPDEPSYLLYGPELRRKVVFLASTATMDAANEAALRFIVLQPRGRRHLVEDLRRHGWAIEPLSSYWTLARRDTKASSETPP